MQIYNINSIESRCLYVVFLTTVRIIESRHMFHIKTHPKGRLTVPVNAKIFIHVLFNKKSKQNIIILYYFQVTKMQLSMKECIRVDFSYRTSCTMPGIICTYEKSVSQGLSSGRCRINNFLRPITLVDFKI